jgi:hypothetical protein
MTAILALGLAAPRLDLNGFYVMMLMMALSALVAFRETVP